MPPKNGINDVDDVDEEGDLIMGEDAAAAPAAPAAVAPAAAAAVIVLKKRAATREREKEKKEKKRKVNGEEKEGLGAMTPSLSQRSQQ